MWGTLPDMRKTTDRAAAWKLVEYELQMLFATHERLGKLEKKRRNKDLRRALTDSFLIHYRNLVEFLSPRPEPRATDITAADYAGDFDSSCAPTQYSQSIHWRLAHLTDCRLDVENKDWDFDLMLKQFKEAWRKFETAKTECDRLRTIRASREE